MHIHELEGVFGNTIGGIIMNQGQWWYNRESGNKENDYLVGSSIIIVFWQ